MRCPQCGYEVAQGAAFCARCGTRVMTPRPEMRHEYALTRILPSWWHFFREIAIACVLAAGGLYRFVTHPGAPALALLLWAGAAAILGMISLARRYTSWSLTSDRLIARRGLIASHRREMELADVRSIEVDRGMMQRMLGLGNVTVASAASTDFVIRMLNIPDPERVAEMLRQARLKRLA
jgi:membrane protein YdbS with pleckstrin-like domain